MPLNFKFIHDTNKEREKDIEKDGGRDREMIIHTKKKNILEQKNVGISVKKFKWNIVSLVCCYQKNISRIIGKSGQLLAVKTIWSIIII